MRCSLSVSSCCRCRVLNEPQVELRVKAPRTRLLQPLTSRRKTVRLSFLRPQQSPPPNRRMLLLLLLR